MFYVEIADTDDGREVLKGVRMFWLLAPSLGTDGCRKLVDFMILANVSAPILLPFLSSMQRQ